MSADRDQPFFTSLGWIVLGLFSLAVVFVSIMVRTGAEGELQYIKPLMTQTLSIGFVALAFCRWLAARSGR